jgi:hypothetical protein
MSVDGMGFPARPDSYAAAGSRTPNDLRTVGADVDGGLHAEAEMICYACDVEIQAKEWVRRGPKGTRHDTCP